MEQYWPTADSDPDATAPMREFAGIWRDKRKLVYSRTLSHAGWGTTVVREIDPGRVRALADAADGDIALGGASLAAAFRRNRLVDEYCLYVHPVLLGRGTRLFADEDDTLPLTLLETCTFGNGVVMLRYGTDA